MEQLKNKAIYEHLYVLQEAYNAHTNITRINSLEDYYLKHIMDSLALTKILPAGPGKLIDVGSGAGYPGLPIAIERPDIEVTLNDSVQKKTKYLLSVAEELQLKNIQVLTGRAEDIGQDKKYREQFDYATARAVAEINVLLELLAPLIRVGGKIFLMKAKDIEAEIYSAKKAEKILNLRLQSIEKYALADLDRSIIVYEKIKSTPSEFSRRPGIPAKTPL